MVTATATAQQLFTHRQGVPSPAPTSPLSPPWGLGSPSPFVWSTTAAGFPAPIITTRSIQIGVSKWPLGSAELEGTRTDASQGTKTDASQG